MQAKPSPEIPTGATRIMLADGGHEIVVREEALFMEVNGTRLLTMRTPMGEQADREWALGFLAGEGVIEDLSEIKKLTYIPAESQQGEANADEQAADLVRVELWRPGSSERLGSLSRTHEMRASCGLCGVSTPEALTRNCKTLSEGKPQLNALSIAHFVEELRKQQPLFNATGGCHGTAIMNAQGQTLAVREDIGRHNALDRAVGACIEQGVYFDECIAVLSGRAGYELVVKCLRVGIPIILSVGAASTFAIELARAGNATLIGFIRTRDGHTHMQVYADAGRISHAPAI